MESHYFDVIECKTAQEFIDKLRPTNPMWLEWADKLPWKNGWIFRGHASLQWELLPSAWRKDNKLIANTKGRIHTRIVDDYKIEERLKATDFDAKEFPKIIDALVSAHAEYTLVYEFVKHAEKVGHPIPSYKEFPNTQDFVEMFLDNIFVEPSVSSPIVQLFRHPAFALAQHHGIPTRLLDWTYSSLVAAFFAAEKALSHQNDHLVVFAIPDFGTQQQESQYKVDDTHTIFPIEYMKAQKGTFSLDIWGDFHFAFHKRLSMIDSIFAVRMMKAEEKGSKYMGEITHPSVKRRMITLPTSEAKTLYQLLWIEDVTRAHVMPTYDNIASTLITKWELISENATD